MAIFFILRLFVTASYDQCDHTADGIAEAKSSAEGEMLCFMGTRVRQANLEWLPYKLSPMLCHTRVFMQLASQQTCP